MDFAVKVVIPVDIEYRLKEFMRETGLDHDRVLATFARSFCLKSLNQYGFYDRCRIAADIMISQWHEKYELPFLEALL